VQEDGGGSRRGKEKKMEGERAGVMCVSCLGQKRP